MEMDIYKSLLNHVSNYVSFDEREKEIFKEAFIFREVPEKYKLADSGKISKELYFLNRGCARLFYLKEGVEVSGYLFTENMFLGSLESFLSGKSSSQIIETVEPSELLVIRSESLETLYKKLPKTNILIRKVLEERFIQAQQLVASFVMDKPEERYLRLIQTNPLLLQKFPQHVLATYLGITPVSLSRIRKRLSENN